MRINLFLLVMMCVVLHTKAQSRILPVLETPSSPQSLSLGGVRMGDINQAYLYNNPTFLFHNASKSVDYSLGFIPSEGRQTYLFHTFTTAYRYKKSAFFLGGRYLTMGSLDDWFNNDYEKNSSLGKIDFYSYSLDVGYAYKPNQSFSFYSTAGYAEEKTVSSIRAYRMDFGASYEGTGKLFRAEMPYSIGLSVANLGKYSYKDQSDFLAPNVRLGGSVSIVTVTRQTMQVFVDGGAFLPVGENDFSSFFSGGVDYCFLNTYSLRIGGHTGDKDDFLSAGFGVKYRAFNVSLGAKIPLRKDLNSMYMLGLKMDI